MRIGPSFLNVGSALIIPADFKIGFNFNSSLQDRRNQYSVLTKARYINLLGMFLFLISGSELDLQYLKNYPEIPYQIGRKAGCVMYFCKLRQADYLEISG